MCYLKCYVKARNTSTSNTYCTNLGNTRHCKLVNEVVLFSNLTKEEINLFLTGSIHGADESRIWNCVVKKKAM